MITNDQKTNMLAMIAQLAQKVESGSIEQPETFERRIESLLHERDEEKGVDRETGSSQPGIDEIPAMIWRSGTDMASNFFNPAWLAFTGRTMEQENGNGWIDGVHSEDRDKSLQVYQNAFIDRQPFEIEFRLRHHSGEYRWVRGIGRPIIDELGEFAGYIGVCFDLTELKEKDRALDESNVLFEGLFEFAPDAVIVVGQRGRIELANRQAIDMFGYSIDELTGQPIEMLMPEGYRSRHQKHLQGYMREPRVRPMGAHLDLMAKRKDGSLFPVDITLGPLETASGIIVLATIREITERKQMESELAEVHRRLIDSAEVERLHLARELHDGPLQDLYSVSFQLSELQDMIASPRGKKLAAAIAEQTQQIASSVRAVCGELRPPSLAPYGLERAIRSHARSLDDQHPGIEIELDLAPDGKALPDRVRIVLFRIYQQAIANAIRHANASKIWVMLQLNDNEVMLEVRDNGRGFVMPRRMLDLVREGHYGLAGSMERAESIGGQYDVKSRPGAGATVRVVAPLSEDMQVGPIERLSSVYTA